MSIKQINANVSVASQISEADIAQVAKAGFHTIIACRPDGEDAGQPTAVETAALVKRYGLDFTHIPVTADSMTDADVAVLAAVLQNADGPVLAYCRSGMRAMMMWALAQADKMTLDEIVKIVTISGYDPGAIKKRILAKIQTKAVDN
jgi:uncharacterized protein (TIGR01244 family)